MITALTAGSKMLPTICIDQSTTGSTVQRCMERMIAVALTSTASLVFGKVLEIMMDSVLQRKKKGGIPRRIWCRQEWHLLICHGTRPPCCWSKEEKERNSIIEKDYHGLIERIKCPPYLFIRSGSPLREKEGRGNKACMQHLLSLLRCCKWQTNFIRSGINWR